MSEPARIEIIVTDMGNGGAYCSKCSYCLDGGDPRKRPPSVCPRCQVVFTGYDRPILNTGGSDFPVSDWELRMPSIQELAELADSPESDNWFNDESFRDYHD